MAFKLDLIGQRFGLLTVIKYVGNARDRASLWKCACSCEGTKVVRGRDLRNGKTSSCGCYRIARLVKYSLKHGKRHTQEYTCYTNAKRRCTKSNDNDWHNYGGRGIEFRFKNFAEFYAATGSKPSPELTLDRIDNDGHYEKGNVRWATRKQQRQNQRRMLQS